MIHDLRASFASFKAALQTRLEYRGDLLLSTLGGLCFQLGPFLAFVILNSYAPVLGGWKADEVLFLFGLWALVLGLSELFLNNIWTFTWQVIDGSIDRLMVLPVNPLIFYLTASPVIHAFANIAVGLGMAVLALHRLDGPWYAFVGIPYWAACGVAIYSGTLIILGSTAVVTMARTVDFLWVLVQVNWAARYPLSVYPAVLRLLLLVLPPLGAYHYLPGDWLFHGGSPWLAFGAPMLAGLACAGTGVICFHWALDHYESTGS